MIPYFFCHLAHLYFDNDMFLKYYHWANVIFKFNLKKSEKGNGVLKSYAVMIDFNQGNVVLFSRENNTRAPISKTPKIFL